MVFENWILRQIFGSKIDKNVECRRLNKELHCLHHSPSIVKVIKSKRLRWTRTVTIMEESRNAFKMLTSKPERRFLLRPRTIL